MRVGSMMAFALAFFGLDFGATIAQEVPDVKRPVVIPQTEVFDIHSAHAEADYQVWVARPVPGIMPFPPGPMKCLYVLDANLFFGTAVEMTRLMSQLYGELPPVLVVGIAYDTQVPSIQSELRARDFTPTVDAGFDAMTQALPGAPEPTLPEDRRLGRAAPFLDFLIEEVIPFIEEEYEVADGGSVLFGSSLGGLFTLYAMMERPDAFDAFISVSPALWWGDGFLLSREEELAADLDDLDTTLFLAVGGGEEREDIPMLAPFKLVSNVQALAERIEAREYESLNIATFIPDGESHTTVVPVALTRGLRFVFSPLHRLNGM
jgi:predicted alpha/beta superfamily hydrolase